MKSAYFSEEETTSVEEKRGRERGEGRRGRGREGVREKEEKQTSKIITTFPLSRSCLWYDHESPTPLILFCSSIGRARKYCSLGIRIQAHDIVPALHLYANIINETVDRFSTSCNLDCLAILMSNHSLSESELDCLKLRSPQTSSPSHYRLVWVGSSIPEAKLEPFLTLKIPVTMRAVEEGIKEFEIDRTQ